MSKGKGKRKPVKAGSKDKSTTGVPTKKIIKIVTKLKKKK